MRSSRSKPSRPGIHIALSSHPASPNHLNLWSYYYVLIQLHGACTCGRSPPQSSHPRWPLLGPLFGHWLTYCTPWPPLHHWNFMQHIHPRTPACLSIGRNYCETALACTVFFCVFSFDGWNILLILNYPKGMDKQIQFTALGYRVPTFPFVQTSCHFT